MTATTSSSLTLQNTKAAAQILAITTSALFAGYTASMSLITVPMMLECFGRSETSKVIVRSDATTSTTTKIDDSGISSRHVGHDKDHVSAPMKLGSVSNNRKFSPPNETLLLSQWRQMYVHGATTARPATAVPVICYLFLLYTCFAESRSGDVRDKDAREQGRQLGSVVLLYTVALMGQCGIVLALTVLRRTNGALGIRCAKVLPPPPPELQDISLRYASHEARSVEREGNIAWTSERLVRRWKWHNDVRSVLLIGGVVAGVYAVVLDGCE